MRNYLTFSVWLILFTCLLGLIGVLIKSLASSLILMPYVLAFYLMSNSLLKRTQVLPSRALRLQLAVGCNLMFWLYSLLAGYIGIALDQKTATPNLDGLLMMLQNPDFKQQLLTIWVFLIVLLIGLSYWFLGKPAARILQHLQQK